MADFDLSRVDFDALRQVDVQTVDPDTLVDIRKIKINENLSREERMKEFVKQVKNPFCFKVGKVAVSIGYANDGSTFEQRMEHYIQTL